jgi:orotidine-5'-phosphate decarboxylase
MNYPFLFVALDDLDKKEKETLETAEKLSDIEGNFGFKVNLDYLLKYGFDGFNSAVNKIRCLLGRPIFADLKMWNGTRTMRSVIEMLVANEVDYLNVYALADNLLPEAIKATEGSKTKVLGLTVLTHFSDEYCRKWFKRSLKETVRLTAEVAIERGCHGIILPGTALEVVQDLKTIKAVPGVRPKWFKDTRHKEEIEPRIAVEKGADILVCGSPLMKATDKIEALKRILEEMKI